MVKVAFEQSEAIVLPKGQKYGYYFDGRLLENLNAIKKIVRKDWDYVYVIDGEVGAGKSWLAQQLAFYLNGGSLDLASVCFTPEEFRDAILRAPKYTSVIFDEAFRGASSRAAMSHVNKALITLLNEIRQKNLFVFVVSPSMWDIDKYIILHRCKGVFHVHTNKNKKRGYYKFYKNTHYMKNFIMTAKNKYQYPKKVDMKGRFTEWLPTDIKGYKKKKADVLGKIEGANKEEEKINHKKIYGLMAFAALKKENPSITITKAADLLKLSRTTLGNWLLTADKARKQQINLPKEGKLDES